jgi:hypothetical protein
MPTERGYSSPYLDLSYDSLPIKNQHSRPEIIHPHNHIRSIIPENNLISEFAISRSPNPVVSHHAAVRKVLIG